MIESLFVYLFFAIIAYKLSDVKSIIASMLWPILILLFIFGVLSY